MIEDWPTTSAVFIDEETNKLHTVFDSLSPASCHHEIRIAKLWGTASWKHIMSPWATWVCLVFLPATTTTTQPDSYSLKCLLKLYHYGDVSSFKPLWTRPRWRSLGLRMERSSIAIGPMLSLISFVSLAGKPMNKGVQTFFAFGWNYEPLASLIKSGRDIIIDDSWWITLIFPWCLFPSASSNFNRFFILWFVSLFPVKDHRCLLKPQASDSGEHRCDETEPSTALEWAASWIRKYANRKQLGSVSGTILVPKRSKEPVNVMTEVQCTNFLRSWQTFADGLLVLDSSRLYITPNFDVVARETCCVGGFCASASWDFSPWRVVFFDMWQAWPRYPPAKKIPTWSLT